MKNKALIASSVFALAMFAPLCAMDLAPNEGQPEDRIQDLQFLMFMDMNNGFVGKQFGQSTFALNSGVPVKWFNNAFASPSTTADDVDAVINFMGGIPFSWRIGKNQLDVKALLEEKGLVCSGKVYLMQKSFSEEDDNQKIDHTGVDDSSDHNEIKIEVKTATDIPSWELWNKISAMTADTPIEYVRNFSLYILNHADAYKVFWYTAYVDNDPISASVLIEHIPSRKATIHLVSGMDDNPYIKQAYSALIKTMLMDAKMDACWPVLIWSSESIHDKDKKLGFKDVETYFIYTQDTPATPSDNTPAQEPTSGGEGSLF